MRQFGVSMQGLEEPFEKLVRSLAATRQKVRYVEIGICHGQTLGAVADILTEAGVAFTAIGIDPAPRLPDPLPENLKLARVVTMTAEEAFSPGVQWPVIDLCLIDGCHSEVCARADFERVEPLVAAGGFVLFHDIDGLVGNWQHHCNMEIGVIRALVRLGLADGTRPGWKRHPDWIGDHENKGADMGVFEKL